MSDWQPPGGESGKSYICRQDGFFERWLAGPVILDVGRGAAGPVLPWAIGVDQRLRAMTA